MRALKFCSALLLLVAAGRAFPLDPHKLLSQYGHTAWRERDGFIVGAIAITQTTDGYIWVATRTGLVRFDGVTFTPWVPKKGQLPSRGFSYLLGARDGSLWIGTSGGLSRMKNGEVFDYAMGGSGISAIFEDPAGEIWFTRYRFSDGKGPLCHVIGKDVKCYGEADGVPGRYGLGLTQDSTGHFWVGCGGALCRWVPGFGEVYLQKEARPSSGAGGDGVVDVVADPSGTVWASLDGIGPTLGVRYFSGGKWASYAVPGFDGATVRSHTLFMDREHSLWVGTESQGLYHVHDGVADHYGPANGLSGSSVSSIYEDREGNLWVTTDGGLDVFRDSPVVTFSTNEGLSGAGIPAVLALGNGSVWIANIGAVDVIGPGDASRTTPLRGLPGQNVSSMFQDQSGRVWLGIDKKLTIYENGRFLEARNSDGKPLGLVGETRAIIEDVHGNIWALITSGRHHILRIEGLRVVENIPLDESIPGATFLAADREGGIWIAAGDKLAHYVNGKFAVSSLENGGSKARIFSIFVDSDNNVWAAGGNGLYRGRNGQFTVMDSRNGLPCSQIASAISDDHGSFWLYAQCGLLRIPASDMAAWQASPESKVSSMSFGLLEGAPPPSRGENQPRVTMSPDGRLWFANGLNVAMIDPNRSYTNTVLPPVHIQEVIADHKPYELDAELQIPPLARDLEIDYTALSFAIPQKVLFRYMLEGRDSAWQEPGTRRQAFYSDLRPGKYRFHVIACNNDGTWNNEGATLDFSVLPAWYQTKLFRILCAATVILIGWMLYRLRMRQIASAIAVRFDERLAERTRLARELHDTLLQTIEGSKMVADDALDDSSNSDRMHGAMKQLSSWLGKAIDEERAALLSLRASTAETNDLSQALQRVLDDCLLRGFSQVDLKVEGAPLDMHPIVRDEIYRIGYEAIRNACEHSGGDRVDVRLIYSRDLALIVRDNGKGISPGVVAHGTAGHFGLQGMRERAARIGGKLNLTSAADSGTAIELIVPGKIVFQGKPRGSVGFLNKLKDLMGLNRTSGSGSHT